VNGWSWLPLAFGLGLCLGFRISQGRFARFLHWHRRSLGQLEQEADARLLVLAKLRHEAGVPIDKHPELRN